MQPHLEVVFFNTTLMM